VRLRSPVRTNPPLCPEQLDDGFSMIDEALEIADRAMGG
jgi:hypothetical protein